MLFEEATSICDLPPHPGVSRSTMDGALGLGVLGLPKINCSFAHDGDLKHFSC